MEQAYKLATRTLKGRLIAPYQREGVLWMLWRELSNDIKGGFMCDEMGLGKTVQTIATMLGNPLKKTLIILPNSIINQWVEEIDHFAPHLKVLIHHGPKRTDDAKTFDDYDIVVTPYSMLVTRSKKETTTVLHHTSWDRIILDEGHEIRNPSSKISKSVCMLNGSIRWIVTGTPVYNSIKDFVTLCKFLSIPKNYVLAMKGKVQDTYVLRRTKEDVAKFNSRLKLPPCDFENVELEMYEDEFDLYEETFSECRDKVKTIFKHSSNVAAHTMEILECLLRCRQAMIHPQLLMNGMAKKNGDEMGEWMGKNKKIEYLVDSIRSHPEEKTLVFSQFVTEMDIIRDALTTHGITVFRIDGSVSQEDRVKQIREFKKCSGPTVFIIQIKAGGQGLNLQQATRVYITSPSWNPATELQAIARSHRTGQSKRVIVKKLLYNGTEEIPSIEHSVMTLQGHKSVICSEVLNDPRIVQQIPTKIKNKNNITIKDLKKIFQI
jgi:SNF2 family DNA or RNA helicase